ncbi:MAG TPA: hypothetical protein VGI73_07115 [Solirubrobacterales bacterium]
MALLFALFAINTSGAQAATAHFYCGTVLPPLGTCNGGAHTNLQGNVALYPGSGSLLVCQQIFDNSTGKYVASSCGVNGTGGESQTVGILGHSLTPFVQNGSSENAHTVNGDWFSP